MLLKLVVYAKTCRTLYKVCRAMIFLQHLNDTNLNEEMRCSITVALLPRRANFSFHPIGGDNVSISGFVTKFLKTPQNSEIQLFSLR